MNLENPIESLNSVKYLYLRQLWEPSPNSLRIQVREAIVDRPPDTDPSPPGATRTVTAYWPIRSTDDCKKFELYWKSYLAYSVTEELVGSNAASGYKDEFYTGKLLREYSRSHFLDHIGRDTGGLLEPARHFKLICLDHLVDVAAYAPPEIQVTGGAGE